ncbi:MAG: asparaginase [Burkholderiales bacterium]|nr:asparaginase [Burkholderiales bacterium]
MIGRKIVVLGTGGTVAGRAASATDNLAYTAGQVAVADLLHGVARPAGFELLAEQVTQVDSKDMDFEVWRILALRCAHWLAQPEVAGVVVTHGTDTMEETAFFLHCVLAPARPVVLTGAMRPATSVTADGPRNVADALAVAATAGAQGVVVVFAGQVHAAAEVAKTHAHRLEAFGSGESAPLGLVDEGGVRMAHPWPAGDSAQARSLLQRVAAAPSWPRVEIVMNYAGAGPGIVEALVKQGVRGIVAAGTGNGTLHRSLEEALVQAQSAGVAVVRSTRCAMGSVVPHARDRLPHSPLPPVKARVALMLELLA